MKVVSIVTQLEPAGAQAAAARVTRGLCERGYEAELWFLYRKSKRYADTEPGRVVFPRRPKSILDYSAVAWRTLCMLRTLRPDAVITYTQYANIIGQCAALVARVPVRVASQRNPPSCYTRFARTVDRWLGTVGVYQRNVMVSRSTLAAFEGYPKAYLRRCCVVRNGIERKASRLSRTDARRKFGLPADGTLLVSVGRLGRQKNHRLLLPVLSALPDVRLAIAGEGEERSAIEEEARRLGVADRLFLCGELLPDDICDFLAAGDVFMQPSLYEGMSVALMEAMTAGIPAIVSDIASHRELCVDAEGGPACVLVGFGDPAAWVAKVRRVLADDAMREQMTGAAKRRIAKFSVRAQVDGFESCLLRNTGCESADAAMG